MMKPGDVTMTRPTHPDERRRALTRIYLALGQDERDALDRQARQSAERQAREKGFALEADPDRWGIEVARLRDKIRDRALTPAEWQQEDAADALKRQLTEEAKVVKPAKPISTPRKGRRAVRGGKDASIRERDGGAA